MFPKFFWLYKDLRRIKLDLFVYVYFCVIKPINVAYD